MAQLSDCHLQADPALPYRGQNADANLEKVWRRVEQWNPDLILLTGDLSEDASETSYSRLRNLLHDNVPVLALPGNHDKPARMQTYFPNGPWDGPLAFDQGSWLIVCLNSKLRGKIEGGFSDEMLDQLQTLLSASSQSHILIALHHQPVLVGAHWIDRYPLSHPQPFLNLVKSNERIRCVVWGHVHHHFAQQKNGVWWLGSPSTAANSVAHALKFELDEKGPACRTLELEDDGEVRFGQLFGNAV